MSEMAMRGTIQQAETASFCSTLSLAGLAGEDNSHEIIIHY